jgi:hypothetical protein
MRERTSVISSSSAISAQFAVIEKMRKFRITFVVIIIFAATMSILWLIVGCQLSMFIDRYETIETVSWPIEGFTIEGHGTGRALAVGEPDVPTDSTAKRFLCLELTMPSGESPHFGTTKNGEAALSFAGKVFAFSSLLAGGTEDMVDWIGIQRPPEDEASFSIRHSALSWMEPLNFNFMTSKSPSWKRRLYYQITWKKPNGARLKMLWRYGERYLAEDGWSSETVTCQDWTELVRVDIQN